MKSKQRVADHGEVFTPPELAEAMLDLVHDETERIDSRFLELACGSGNLLESPNVFNSTHINQAVFAFRRYEDSSLSYTGIASHGGLRHYGLYDTVVAREG